MPDGGEVKVSDCDLMFIISYRWNKDNRGYYRCSSCGALNGNKINGKRLHWFIVQRMNLEIPVGMTIDHIDRDKFNNQRSNFRAASLILQRYNINKMKNNKSGFVGVVHKDSCTQNPWVAIINNKHLGCFKTPEEASEVYQAAKKIRDEKEEQRCLNI